MRVLIYLYIHEWKLFFSVGLKQVVNFVNRSLTNRGSQELAVQVVQSEDLDVVKELVGNLRNPDKNIQSDCIKVLYEIGVQKPELIKAHQGIFSFSFKIKTTAWYGVL